MYLSYCTDIQAPLITMPIALVAIDIQIKIQYPQITTVINYYELFPVGGFDSLSTIIAGFIAGFHAGLHAGLFQVGFHTDGVHTGPEAGF
jgi:hypothetical protein